MQCLDHRRAWRSGKHSPKHPNPPCGGGPRQADETQFVMRCCDEPNRRSIHPSVYVWRGHCLGVIQSPVAMQGSQVLNLREKAMVDRKALGSCPGTTGTIALETTLSSIFKARVSGAQVPLSK